MSDDESDSNTIIVETSQTDIIINDTNTSNEPASNKENTPSNLNQNIKSIYTKISENLMNDLYKKGKFNFDYEKMINGTKRGSQTSKNTSSNSKTISDFLERNAKLNMKKIPPPSFSQKNGLLRVKLTPNSYEHVTVKPKTLRSPKAYHDDQMRFVEEKNKKIDIQRQMQLAEKLKHTQEKPTINKNSEEIAKKLITKGKSASQRLFESVPKRKLMNEIEKNLQQQGKKVDNQKVNECVDKLYKEGVERSKKRSQSNIPLHMEKVALFYSRHFSSYNSNIRTNAKVDSTTSNPMILTSTKNKILIINKILQEMEEPRNNIVITYQNLHTLLYKVGLVLFDHQSIKSILDINTGIEKANVYNSKGIDEAIEDVVKRCEKVHRWYSGDVTKEKLLEEEDQILSAYSTISELGEGTIKGNEAKLFVLIVIGFFNGKSKPEEKKAQTPIKKKMTKTIDKKQSSKSTSCEINVEAEVDGYILKKLSLGDSVINTYSFETIKKIKTKFKIFYQNRKKFENFFFRNKNNLSEERSVSKSAFTFKPKIKSNKGESTKLESTYFILQQRHMNEIEQLQKEKINKELKDCTFAPNNKKVDRSKSIEISNRLYSVCKRKKTENINSSIFNDKECTFSPKTNKKLKENIFTINPIKDDPLFNYKIEQYEKARIEKKLVNFISCQGGASLTKLRNSDELLKEFQNQQNYENFKFGLEKKTNKDTFDKFGYKGYNNYVMEGDKKELPMFTIEVKIKDRIEFLDYYKNDDPARITRKFCKRHGLGESSNEKILAVIEDKLKNTEVTESNNS